MKNEIKIAEAMSRVLSDDAAKIKCEVALCDAAASLVRAKLDLLRVCHVCFGTADRQIIYKGKLWQYTGSDKHVTTEAWDGLIIDADARDKSPA